jgi:peptidoglycan hydrolase-like protein with peptidoglycan-binding domain
MNVTNPQGAFTMPTATQRPTLTKGATGTAVTELQKLLRQRINSDLAIDGVFGTETESMVKAVQFTAFLERDGIVGPKTWATLEAGKPVNLPTLRRGSRSPLVERVQNMLKFEGFEVEALGQGYYKGALDGDFGAQTEAAVKAFQIDTRFHSPALTGDGMIGDKTWDALGTLAQTVVHIAL